MLYRSTRGQSPDLNFEDAVMTGLAPDGGLYVPRTWPQWSHKELRALRGLSFQEIAVRVLLPFVTPSLTEAELRPLVDRAYAHFDHPQIAPLSQLGDTWLLELYHGPPWPSKTSRYSSSVSFLPNSWPAAAAAPRS